MNTNIYDDVINSPTNNIVSNIAYARSNSTAMWQLLGRNSTPCTLFLCPQPGSGQATGVSGGHEDLQGDDSPHQEHRSRRGRIFGPS